MTRNRQYIILGAGLTGLAAGVSSGFKIYERNQWVGGICATYGITLDGRRKVFLKKTRNDVFKFEVGGGHWLWGTNRSSIAFLRRFSDFKRYKRKSSVYLSELDLLVPTPLQYNLWKLPQDLAKKAFEEIVNSSKNSNNSTTMETWLINTFGETLSELFFLPFNKLYTAGLLSNIAPSDQFKNPMDLSKVKLGLRKPDKAYTWGYNLEFRYPILTWGVLAWRMAEKCHVEYGKQVVEIDLERKRVYFSDGSHINYYKVISTLPLNSMLSLIDLNEAKYTDPYTSILVTNISGIRGPTCPEDHWIYLPNTKSGFHRVGIYTNVSRLFLASSLRTKEWASFYAEKAYPGRTHLSLKQQEYESYRMAYELKDMGYLKEIEIVDPTWVQTAYTYRLPRSNWKEKALSFLKKQGIIQVGRYATWGSYQSILESVTHGLIMGSKLHALDGFKKREKKS